MFHMIEGNIGKAEMRAMDDGKPYLRLSVAVSNRYIDRTSGEWVDKAPTWWDFTLWGEQAMRYQERVESGQIAKGQRAIVEFGKAELRPWTAQDGTTKTSLVGSMVHRVSVLQKASGENGHGENGANGEAAAEDDIA